MANARPTLHSDQRAPLRLATQELDRLYERLRGSGLGIQLTDANGAVLYEKPARLLRAVVPRSAEPNAVTSCSGVGEECAPRMSSDALTLTELAGDDPQMLRIVHFARRVADCQVPVLLLGPTGSGKEAFAHAMHLASLRAQRAFVAVNCAAIPETLIESELFGYKSGAFTGARREGLRGKILQSSGGTLFLDEIGDMPLSLQSRLLRVLEEQAIVALGSETATPVRLHVIAASNRNVRDLVAHGAFRADLYYRLNGITLELPALRQRADRKQLICRLLTHEAGPARPAALEPGALQCLLSYSWPGNIRELRNVLRAALAICEGGVIRRSDLPEDVHTAPPPDTQSALPQTSSAQLEGNPLRVAERAALLQVIRESRGNMTRAAARLEISRNTLYRRLRRHDIPLAQASRLRTPADPRVAADEPNSVSGAALALA